MKMRWIFRIQLGWFDWSGPARGQPNSADDWVICRIVLARGQPISEDDWVIFRIGSGAAARGRRPRARANSADRAHLQNLFGFEPQPQVV